MLWNSNDGNYFYYPQNIIHIPVLMNETAFSFVLESYHCFHDIICENPKEFNIPFS